MTFKRFALCVALVLLPGCSSLDDLGEQRIEAATFEVADLSVALDNAKAHDDDVAVACWTLLKAAAERWRDTPVAVGPASALQQLRNYRRFLQSEELSARCSPLLPSRQLLRALRAIAP